MFNFYPYSNYYRSANPSYYSYYNNPAFFYPHYNIRHNFNEAKMYQFKTPNSTVKSNNKINLNNNETVNEENKEGKNNQNEQSKEEKKENVRFRFGDFCITDIGMNILGMHLNFDDIIIILLIIFLYFETNCDMSLIIILALMLFNINLSTIKNIF